MLKTPLLISLLLIATHAYAAEKHEGPCHEDMQKYCATAGDDHASKMKCMKENESKFSQACKDHVVKMKEAMKEVKEACQEDVHKLCADVKPGKGRIMKCMKEHHDELSEGCKSEIESKKSMRKKMRKGH